MNLALLCHTEESVQLLPQSDQELVLELADLFGADLKKPPFNAVDYIKKAFGSKGLRFPEDIFKELEPDDSMEVWTKDFRFVFAMGNLLRTTTYKIDDLALNPWADLFDRPEFVQKQIVTRFIDAIATGKSQFNVTDYHEVRETKTSEKRTVTLKVKQLTPYFNKKNQASGCAALVKFKRPWLS